MPIYVYQCQQCGAQKEVMQKFSDPPLTECQECGGKLEKIIQPVAIHFKGTGWYVTDYARKDQGKPEKRAMEQNKEEKKEKKKEEKKEAKDTGTSSVDSSSPSKKRSEV